ncbi:MAG TPA: RNA chaperone Hfq [Clostridiaceae bacterium]|jgi:host factor-I protein|nr:RNA chaperone Hfq [Clostridiaceae bacterium]
MEHNFKMNQSKRKQVPLSQSLRIQETFLNHCRREKINVVIQLFDQSIVEGLIVGFDQESIVVASRGTQQLLYKSSIVCIRPFEELHLIFNDGFRGGRRGTVYPRVTSTSSYRQH